MIENEINNRNNDRNFLEYKEQNPHILMIYMILSLSSYLIVWLFFTNKFFEKIDENAPDSRRAGIILFFFPISLAILNYIFGLIFTSLIAKKIIFFFNVLVLSIIIFLNLQYLYDFCNSFGKFTRSSILTWYLFLYAGYFSFILLFFTYWTFFLIIIPMFTVPAMQDILNKKIQSIKLRNERNEFEQIIRKK